jgi:hypothetical protein
MDEVQVGQSSYQMPPQEGFTETRCYIRDPDGYIIEVRQSKPGFKYG